MNSPERGPIGRPALARCIRVPAEEFGDRYWGREPLLSTADELGSGFDDLFSATAVDELVSRRGVRTPFIRMAQEGAVLAASAYTASGGFGAEIADQVSSDKVLAEFADGATIVLQGLHRLWPPIIDFTRALVDDLGHPAQVNAYVTPPSSQGFDPHYDTHDVFVLQISGEKHWRIHPPVLVDPLRTQPWDQHRAAVARRATHEPAIDAVLRPGDALYLPRGWIHSATALGETSVHLTVGMSAYTRADLVDALIGEVGDNAALRTSLPLGVDLRDPEALKPIVEQTVQALIETLQQTDASRPAASLSARFDAETRAEPLAPLATLEALATLDASTPVRWRGSLPVRIETVEDRVRIVARAKTLSLPAEAEAAVRRLAAGDPVTVGELPGIDSESAVVVVRRLVREGFVVAAA
ncbi:cupin domain-containing protein [Agromyces ramosus]|uniref:Lysine-specific demethylase/histidyl-hydroxylase NO66 n=1 Tax=Agromyces ramosus TaxID=33879 RepID=A0ABU0R9Y1_9MICO|nr:cupin domain-containing protein [Agromyces ramosus]MDQ0894883.1 lysine-specific demethylase/histidyl-hydroxylase NO66 [Agromyces ramosus]